MGVVETVLLQPGEPPRLDATWRADTLILSGRIMGDGTETQRDALTDGLRRTLGNAVVVNSVSAEPAVASAPWVGQLPRLLRVVWGDLEEGSLVIAGGRATVTGTVGDENVRAEIGERLAALVPGLTVDNRVDLPGGAPEAEAGTRRHPGTGRHSLPHRYRPVDRREPGPTGPDRHPVGTAPRCDPRDRSVS